MKKELTMIPTNLNDCKCTTKCYYQDKPLLTRTRDAENYCINKMNKIKKPIQLSLFTN